MNSFKEYRAVARLAETLAARRGFSPAEARQIRIAALLHDIGKINIDPAILCKPGKLTPQEFEIVKTHTTLGAEMLESLCGGLGELVKNVCRYHHEWHNPALGGYWGISAAELPSQISIISICDVYVAMTSARPYKEALTVTDALGYIRQQAGTQFSHELVEDFHSLINGCAAAVL